MPFLNFLARGKTARIDDRLAGRTGKVINELDSPLDSLLGPETDPVAAGMRLRELASDRTITASELLRGLDLRRERLSSSDLAVIGGLLRLVHVVALRAVGGGGPDGEGRSRELVGEGDLDVAVIDRVLSALPASTPNRFLLLHLLAIRRSRDSLAALVVWLRRDVAANWVEAGQVLSPLMQHPDWPIDAAFPELLETLGQPALAAPVLDLANFLVRGGRTGLHPARDRVETLKHLLGEITRRLDRFEEDPHSFGDDVATVQDRLGEAVALAVSLCDTLGLLGDRSALGPLRQAMELRHRRVQCEAAGAAARLGEEIGRERLLELTADPAARLRAIRYSDELGLGDRVDPRWRDPEATAEAEMALWLSQPQQMGVPPTEVEVVASRRLHWPSFSEPVDVRLVRFAYRFADRQYSNVGIAGPAVFAMSADVADLPHDDIFAIYAGWHAEHPEIFSVSAEKLNEAQRRLMGPLARHLEQSGYESLRAELLGFLLDEHAGVFGAVRDGTECLVVTDGLETLDRAVAGRLRPLGAVEMFHWYKGRKLLRTFNG